MKAGTSIRRSFWNARIAALLPVMLPSTHARAQCIWEGIQPAAPQARAEFGRGVAASGDLLVVGAPMADMGFGYGSVYVLRYAHPNWAEEAKLRTSDGSGPLGTSVATDGARIAAASVYDHEAAARAGAVYVYERVGGAWSQTAKLIASDAVEDHQIGRSLAMNAGRIVAGAQYAGGTGAAYVFVYDGKGWIEEAKLVASDGAPGDEFASAVAIFDDVIVVGAPSRPDGGGGGGAAYVFRRTGSSWSEESCITLAPGAGDSFGSPVALNEQRMVVCGLEDNSPVARVYEHDGAGWTSSGAIAFGMGGAAFAAAAAVHSDRIAIGSAFAGDDHQGAVHVFALHVGGWVRESTLIASAPRAGDYLGMSVGLTELFVAAGAAGRDDAGEDAGAVYVSTLSGDDCNANGTPDECDILAGLSLDCDADGLPDECEVDADHDGMIDGCDACPNDVAGDSDGDGVCDSQDACPGADDRADSDADGRPDACDDCPDDADGDGVCDSQDRCPGHDDLADADGDSVADCMDQCPGLDDALDADGDGVADCAQPVDADAEPAPEDESDAVPPGSDAAPYPDDSNSESVDEGDESVAQESPLVPFNMRDGSGSADESLDESMPGCGAGACGAGVAPAFTLALTTLAFRRRRHLESAANRNVGHSVLTSAVRVRKAG